MTTPAADDPMVRFTDPGFRRPFPAPLAVGRRDLLAAIAELRTIADADLTHPWPWIGGSEEEIRYGFYRISESFELAGIEAGAALRATAPERGRAADRIAPATAARWDLHGLLIAIPDAAWDADPGGGEWTIRQTFGHVIEGQRHYGAATAWWSSQGFRPVDPELPSTTPEEVFAALPSKAAEAEGTSAALRERLDDVLDRSSEVLAGLPDDRLGLGTRWSGFAVDIGFRLGRWSSHIREHTVQVEKTLVMLNHQPTEVDRLVRLVLAAWGQAESVVCGAIAADTASSRLARAAAEAHLAAIELTRFARA
jgi:hypothetical protein